VTASKFEQLRWPEIAEAVRRGSGIILPIGAIEQHGPHLPLDTDSYLADEIALAAATGFDLLVAPMIPYGYRSRPLSGGGPDFPGTISLSGELIINVVAQILSELASQGFRRFVIYSWHMENRNFVYEAAHKGLHNVDSVKAVVMESPFADLSAKTMALLFDDDFPGWPAEHASTLETSLMLHLRPDAVDMSKALDDRVDYRPEYEVIPTQTSMTTRSGVMARATLGSAEKGAVAFAEIVHRLKETIASEFPELVKQA
jgi:creatinine amidohydrolase